MLHGRSGLDLAVRLALALVLALPLGWDRERRSRSAGLRTYPLLSACACGFLLLPQALAWDAGGQADLFYGLLSGIGFVASGAVLKSRRRAREMDTAVSLWVTVSVGIAASYQLFVLATVLSAATVVALTLLKPLKRRPEEADKGVDRKDSS